MKYIIFAIIALAIQGCSTFPAATIPILPTLKPIPVTPSSTKKLYFSAASSKLDHTSIGQMKVGTVCMNERELKWGNYPKYNDEFREKIKEAFVKNHYNISNDNFELKNQQEAEILLGARVTKVIANICSSRDGTKGVSVVYVDWETYNKYTKESIVIKSSGKGYIPEFSRTGYLDLYSNAVADAAENLMANEEFHKIIKSND
ncbi:MAG: hypothetical protein COA99_17650 [Moraxellaceae bacterium]|nr:MAG: hypothetical protein COA99_17650 [Moraxellaceae bacterium]